MWHRKAYHAIPLSGLIMTEIRPEESIRWMPNVQIGPRTKNVLSMHPSCSVSCRLYIPARAKFSSYIALTSDDVLEKNRHNFVFGVEVSDGDAKIKIVRTKLIHPKHFYRRGKWKKFKLRLGRLANHEVRIVLSTSIVGRNDPFQALAVWGEPTVCSVGPSLISPTLRRTSSRPMDSWEQLKRLFQTRKPEVFFLGEIPGWA